MKSPTTHASAYITKEILPCLLSALLLILSFPKYNLEFLSWFAFIPLFFAIKDVSCKTAFLISYFCGIVFFLGTIYWLAWVTMLGYILVSFYLALYFGIFGLLVTRQELRVTKRNFSLIFVPSIWVLLEYLRSVLLTGFPWNLLSHSQYLNLPVIQIADVTGAYGVSFFIMTVNVGIYKFITERKKAYLIIPLIFIFSVTYYGYFRLTQPIWPAEVKICVIQGNISQEEKWDEHFQNQILDVYVKLTKKASLENPDIIIWPETSIPGDLEGESYLFKEVTGLAKDIKIPLLVGTIRRSQDDYMDRFFNNATFIDTAGSVAKSYSKVHLVPFGEYVPLGDALSWIRNYILIGNFIAAKDYTIFEIKKYKFATLICFEDIFANLVRRFVKNGAGFLVNITNDAWFGNTNEPYQHAQASVLRAVETRRPVVRCANTGLSCFINIKGKITETVKNKDGKEIFIEGFKTASIATNQTQSIYLRYGDWFVALCFLLTGWVLYKNRYA